MQKFDTDKANQAARDSFTGFFKPIGNTVESAISYGLNAANPLKQGVKGIQELSQLPSVMKKLDGAYGDNIRASAAKRKAKNAKLPQLNKPNTSNGGGVASTPTQTTLTGGTAFPTRFSFNDVINPKDYVTLIGQINQTPNNYVESLSGAQYPPLPGSMEEGPQIPAGELTLRTAKEFNQQNMLPHLKETGYRSDNDPAQIEAKQQANEVQDRRMKTLSDFASGKFSGKVGASFAGLPNTNSSTGKFRSLSGRRIDNQQANNQATLSLNNKRLQAEQEHRKSLSDAAMVQAQNEANQQAFDNDLAMKDYLLREEEQDKSKYLPHYAKTVDGDTGNKSESFAGAFNPSTGKYTAVHGQQNVGFESYAKEAQEGLVNAIKNLQKSGKPESVLRANQLIAEYKIPQEYL